MIIYDETGELISPGIIFPIRGDLDYGDSVVVIRGNESFVGFQYSCSILTGKNHYYSYRTIVLFIGGEKLLYIECDDGAIQVYYSRAVITEKYFSSKYFNL